VVPIGRPPDSTLRVSSRRASARPPRAIGGILDGSGIRTSFDEVGPAAYNTPAEAGNLFRLMSADQKDRLVGNIVDSMQHVSREIQLRQLCHFFRADPSYGADVAMGLGIDLADLPGMTREVAHA
jgi:Catalase-related immune-responsive